MIYLLGRNFKTFRLLLETTGYPVYEGQKDAILVISWGYPVRAIPEKVVCLNRNPVTNKLRACELMEAAKVSIPKSFVDVQKAKEWASDTKFHDRFIVKPIETAKGKGMLLTNLLDLEQTFRKVCRKYGEAWIQEFIPKDKEYRSLFIKRPGPEDNGYIIVKTFEKVPRDERAKRHYIWNLSNSDWVSVNKRPSETEPNIAKAAAACRVDWGAADFGTKDGKVYIFELNTRPGLLEQNCRRMFKQFERWRVWSKEKGR